MKKIVIVGTGYVGLVTGVCLAEIGYNIWCLDIDNDKIDKLSNGDCPFFEPELKELLYKNKNKLFFTTNYKDVFDNAEIVFICVGTPEKEDGSANLEYIYSVCDNLCESLKNNCTVVIKSTVPIGTNDLVEEYFRKNLVNDIEIKVVSNPEFLSQGSAIKDTLKAPRIIVGSDCMETNEMMYELYKPFTKEPYNIPYLSMSRRSAEMVKYASNNFLALKISFINEIANFCETINADIDDVTNGMKYDERIGKHFLRAGIGYGGSCFPKDTKALHYISKINNEEIITVRSAIEVNKNQKIKLFKKIKEDYKNLKGLKVAVLGCSFKPKTEDLRESPSIDNIKLLLEEGCRVSAYDPFVLALNNLKQTFSNQINYYNNIDECIKDVDLALIITEHHEIVEYDLNKYIKYMRKPVIYDGRNCYSLDMVDKYKINYTSIGRRKIIKF
ncbi:MAG: UDP-glucose/GDP-mannose dehydrogenase family protein [Bacilli bacterium]|nr:UDP-glucose/GDP-mannose dehydrogenase family protein [Bacilli bacterium]MDD4808845.1 UDP-glucose/GDP-mannose dehydrogenase family protein [Bacilli bacterium]